MTQQPDRLNTALAGHYLFERELGAALGPDRFPREIRLLARLQHPHIQPLLDSGEADGFLY